MSTRYRLRFTVCSWFTCFLFAGLVYPWLLPGDSVHAQSNCTEIYKPGNGWVIQKCLSDPSVQSPMDIVLDNSAKGQGVRITILHQDPNTQETHEVAIIYSSGFVRLKHRSADPYGSSFVLGPAYWSTTGNEPYHHNPQLVHLDIDTRWLPSGPLRLHAIGTNQAFNVAYELTFPPPRERQTRMHVTQIYTATTDIVIDPMHRSKSEGFKLVQISSMFINESGNCDGGTQGCHDSNAIRFIGDDRVRHQIAYADLAPSTFLLNPSRPLGSTWLDALHTDNQGWQGNTPNIRIALDVLPTDRTLTPQGWFSATNNPTDDNIGIWLHDDGSASQSWNAGQHGQISYWLLAQDNPPEPWADLSLNSGQTFLDFENNDYCEFVRQIDQTTSGSIQRIAGYSGDALQLNYDLGSNADNWAQVRCNFNPPLDLSTYDHLRFNWRGDPLASNSLQVGVISLINGQERIFARGYHHPTHHGWWGQMVVPFQFLEPWTAGSQFDPSKVSSIFFSVVKDPKDDVGGKGNIAIDNLNAFNIKARLEPTAFERVRENLTATTAAVNWLTAQQQTTGLLKSWAEEPTCIAHTYDQALALLVFSQKGKWAEAHKLGEALSTTQNNDGSWFKSRNCLTLEPVHNEKWEGDIAWAIYALSRYIVLGGEHPQAAMIRDKGAAWLRTRFAPATGCLQIDHTEATIDAWWAFQAAGSAYADEADGLKQCLLTSYWDDSIGRFKGGVKWWQPYLDNQTWGAAFLKGIGEEAKARRALSFARATMLLPAQGHQLYGLDGQGGPWSVWNEGIGQFVAVGGPDANELRQELLAQQRADGALPGSPDDFSGGGVWTTRWVGVAPTAWLVFAETGEPFHVRPRAAFTMSPASAITPFIVAFTNTSTGEFDQSLWNFGDGFTSTQISPTHVYQTAGVYTVTLKVSGIGGADTLTHTRQITVVPTLHQLSMEAEVVTCNGSPMQRSAASGQKTVLLHVNESCTFSFTVPSFATYTVYAVTIRYSNDGPPDTVTFMVDKEKMEQFTTVDTRGTGPSGSGWDRFQQNEWVASSVQRLHPEVHTLVVHNASGDSFGVEIDMVRLIVGVNPLVFLPLIKK